MNVDLRPVGLGYSHRRAVMLRSTSGRRGMGQTCQVPQPGVTMVYPPCPSEAPVGTPPAATYVAPAYITPPSCLDPSGNAIADPSCVTQLLAVQAQNLGADTAANYNVLRANCENDWAANAVAYQSDGLPVPPNNCSQRTFGLTLPGSTGSTNALIPNAAALLSPNYSGPVAAAPPPPPPPAPPPAPPPPAVTTHDKLVQTFTNGGGAPPSGSTATSGDGAGGGGGSASSPNPALYWVGGLAAVALLYAVVTR